MMFTVHFLPTCLKAVSIGQFFKPLISVAELAVLLILVAAISNLNLLLSGYKIDIYFCYVITLGNKEYGKGA